MTNTLNVDNPRFTASVTIDAEKKIAFGHIQKRGENTHTLSTPTEAASLSVEMFSVQSQIVELAVQAGIPKDSVRLIINLKDMYGAIVNIRRNIGAMPRLTRLMNEIDYIVTYGGENRWGNIIIGMLAGLRKEKIITADSHDEALEKASQPSAKK